MDSGERSPLRRTPKLASFQLKSYAEMEVLLDSQAVRSGEYFAVEGKMSDKQVLSLSQKLNNKRVDKGVILEVQLKDGTYERLESARVVSMSAADEALKERFLSDISNPPSLSFMQPCLSNQGQGTLRTERVRVEEHEERDEVGVVEDIARLGLFSIREESAAAAAEEERDEEHGYSNSRCKNS